jgi:hypothetical protein
MSRQTVSLEEIRIASPCPVAWEDMAGTSRVRFCQVCQERVYNLSAMTRKQAERLIGREDGPRCVRLYRRHDGTVRTSDCPIGLRAIQHRLSLWIGIAAAGLLAAVTWGGALVGLKVVHQPRAADDRPAAPDAMMGAVCVPPPPPLPPLPPQNDEIL